MKKFLIIIVLLILVSNTASAVSEITLNDVKKPQSAILFIVDGFGSSYYYPELTPIALDGGEIPKAITQNLSFGARVINIKTPTPVTGIAHSVIVTGDSKANEEIVGYPDATIYDITRQHGFVNLAVMETGDFSNMRAEQDIILFAENNSLDKPLISIQIKNAPSGVYELMYDWKMKMPSYLNNLSGTEKYAAYNKWSIDAANAVAGAMIENHPNQKFLLTVNVGEIDSGGHNLGNDDYVKLIEDLDRDFYPLYRTASDNNIALFLTADHGMSFATKNARRGGHSGDKYVSKQESLRIPLVILSPNAVSGVVSGEYGQEDIAPTLLSVLDLPNHLQYADGKTINIKNYASIFIKADSQYTVSLWNDGGKLSESQDSELVFAGLPLNTSYTLKAAGAGGTYEEHVSLDSDKEFNFKSAEAGLGIRNIIAIILILIVIIAGIIIIKRIK
ncbi:MAG: alkaline phosphatase family protein [Candidatus Methanoperedens sp.]|nr:alkaline phosphatase family protein [Candidatus Methanoperedens sp.]MCZ7394423.1 alkaline phosphatase family protein [Candidatus Methanoperedens sp.]